MPVTSVVDERPPEEDGALAIEEHRAILQAAEQLLDDVDRALASLDDGSYGICEVCGAPVDDADLEEDPVAIRCSLHRVTAA
ncbi:MAG: TraR/DksA family transcriptional regulator [Acidimicrobiales bacterium]